MNTVAKRKENEFRNKTSKIQNIDNSNELKLNHEIGDFIIKKHRLVFIEGLCYRFCNGIWENVPDLELEKVVQNTLKNCEKQISSGLIKTIIDYIKRERNIKRKANENHIAFKNGIYNIADQKFIKYSDETKKLYITNTLSANYDTTAQCPRWMQFVNEIFAGDIDKDDKINLLQEYLGYCLTKDNSFQTCLILFGEGANGKSVILELMEHILTKANISTISFEDLDKDKYVIQLRGKNVNITSEVNARMRNPFQQLKKIVGADTLTGRELYKNVVSFRNTAKLIFALNELPYTKDNTDGFYRKITILKFNNQFKGSNADKNLCIKLKEEADGIINWMLVGLKRLMLTKLFTSPVSSNNILDEYKESNNSILSFVKETCELDGKNFYPFTKLFDDYKNYCKETKMQTLQRQQFKKELIKSFAFKEPAPQKFEWKTQRCIAGIKYVGEEGKLKSIKK